MNIYLVRHGKIQGAEVRRFIGSTDVPLSDEGVRQGRLLRDHLAHIRFDRVYSSDMTRTLTFACIISNLPENRIHTLKELCEIDLGTWEGKTFKEIQTCFPEQWRRRGEEMDTFRPPRGESFSDLAARVIPCFENITSGAHSNILIVGHAGVNRVILSHILKTDRKNLFSIPQAYAALTVITRSRKNEYTIHPSMFPE